jgi:glycosyltransferase involved in cell wall biosynthesis
LKISACIIVRDEPLLAQAVASIRPYVDEVVIVDTGSADTSSVWPLTDKFLSFTDCNDEFGNMADFSVARQKSLELATHDCIVWIDADDVLVGGEFIQDAIRIAVEKANGSDWRIVCPYEYAHNEHGECTSFQGRERIVSDKSKFRWDEPVHEALVPAFGQESINVDEPRIQWIHKRSKPVASDRNLRILRAHAKKVEASGARLSVKTRFYLGAELARCGDHLKAISNFICYVEESGWDEERVLACLHLVGIFAFYPGREDDALLWAQRAIDIRPEWCEGYFAVAKLAYARASSQPATEKKHLQRAVYYAQLGLACKETRSPISTNPMERTVDIPLMLQDCYERLGMYQERLEMLNTCVKARPENRALRLLQREASGYHAARGGMDIVFACAVTDEEWNPDTARERGIGGSETAVIEMARRLADLGHRVRVFCSTPADGLFDGVEYRSMARITDVRGCDILIAWRDAGSMDYVPAKSKWLWVHDTSIGAANSWNLHLADRVLALSDWHAKHLIEKASVDWEKVSTTRNGLDLSRFTADPPRTPHRALYTSSPDRGLEQLLDVWPQVRAGVPDAELHVFYGWDMLERMALRDPKSSQGVFFAVLKEKLAALDGHGVFVHGRVDQKALADEMLRSGVWVHPSTQPDGTEFTETSCIGSLEAQAAGMNVVYRPVGALPESVRVGMPILDLADLATYVMAAMELPAQKKSMDFGWDGVIEQWLHWMEADLAKAPRATSSDSKLPLLHMVLAPRASGGIMIDAANPDAVAHGGGCRSGFLGLAKAMAAKGYRVRAFSTFLDRHVERNGVEYIRLDQMRSYGKPDALLAYYDTSPLVGETGMLRIASHHTYTPYAHFEWSDVNTAPSQPAVDHLRDRYEPHGTWYVLPNGVELSVERKPVPGRVIYHTSPDRGLHLLLAVWPEIRRRLPHATLHVVGPVEEASSLADIEGVNPKTRHRATLLRDGLLAAQEAGGVELLGRVSRPVLDNELAEASLFAFPGSVSAPCETFSVSIMECLAIGLPVVMSPVDALKSVYEGAVTMVPSPAEDHMAAFIEAVVVALRDGADTDAGQRLAARYTFEEQAAHLDKIIVSHEPEIFSAKHRPKANGCMQSEAFFQ